MRFCALMKQAHLCYNNKTRKGAFLMNRLFVAIDGNSLMHRAFHAIAELDDGQGNPTNAVDLAYHILKLAVSHDYGIYHCTGNGICSWYDFACAIMQGAGLSCKVEPVTSAEYAAANPASASRPAWSALENRMLRCTVGDEMRDWQDALKDFFANWNGEL